MLDKRSSSLLLKLLKSDLHIEPEDGAVPVRGFMHVDQERSIFFFGKAHDLLTELQRRLARNLMSHDGGMPPDAVAQLLVAAYRLGEQCGWTAAISWFNEELERPNPWWKVFLGLDDVLPLRADVAMSIAGCTLHSSSPPGVGALGGDAWFARDHPLPLLEVTVRARDAETARLLADAKAAELRGLLALGMSTVDRTRSRHITIPGLDPWQADGTPAHIAKSQQALLPVSRICDRDGRLWPGVHELAQAAALAPSERPPWADRTLRASRWYFEYMTTSWHTHALVAAMNVFECLLLRDMEVTPKGAKLAAAITRTVPLRHMSAHAQREWLKDVYILRSRAVHEGLTVTEDLQVEALFPLLSGVMGWAVNHLDPMHRADNVGCSSFEEVNTTDVHVALG